MCGIFASWGVNQVTEKQLVQVSHRGPDAFHSWTERLPQGHIILAHWRLSIIDLSSDSDQPFRSPDGKIALIFNGEIYNYRELKAELVSLGHIFRTSGDTEVVLEAWREWGEGCLDHFRGMFAIVLIDSARGVLFAARDRFGIKPLYFLHNDAGTVFGSEIKQLLPFLARRSINQQRVRDFLIYGAQDHTDETMFEGIRQLRGGECALLDLRQHPATPLAPQKWYEIGEIQPFAGDFEQAVHEYRKLFLEVIALHLRSDVPLGSCLSGGMDSSAVVGSVAKLLSLQTSAKRQEVFHCTYPFPGCDESVHAKAVVAQADADAHFLSPNAEELFSAQNGYHDLLSRLVWHQDEPLNNASIFSQYCVFRSAAESGIKVLLDGQGGDEQLASYPQFFGPFLLSLLRRFRFAEAIHEASRLNETHGWRWLDTARSLVLWHAPNSLSNIFRFGVSRSAKYPWATEQFLLDGGLPVPPWKRATAYPHEVSTGWMSRMMLSQLTLPMLLHWEDRNSMAHSLEARVPFMDHKLIEFALSMPDEFKISNGDTKVLLKSAMSGLVPRQIINRRDKKGFTTPEEMWLRKDPKGQWSALIKQAAENSPDIFSEGLETCWNEFLQSKAPLSPLYWRAITFGVWRKVFDV